MKKVIILLTLVFLVAIAASSCKSSNKCAAYGENHKYQKESKY